MRSLGPTCEVKEHLASLTMVGQLLNLGVPRDVVGVFPERHSSVSDYSDRVFIIHKQA